MDIEVRICTRDSINTLFTEDSSDFCFIGCTGFAKACSRVGLRTDRDEEFLDNSTGIGKAFEGESISNSPLSLINRLILPSIFGGSAIGDVLDLCKTAFIV